MTDPSKPVKSFPQRTDGKSTNPSISSEQPSGATNLKKKERAVLLHHQQSISFSGPLPPPDILMKYEQILPGAAERIFKMTENQGQHRRSLESSVVTDGHKNERLGIWLGFILAVLCLAFGCYALYLGHTLTGLTSVFTTIGSISGSFIYATYSNKEERETRLNSNQPQQNPPQESNE